MGVEASTRTFLERRFPFRELSMVLRADRRVNDPAYRVHRWWARRPPGLMRALLIAAASDESLDEREFWRLFSDPDFHLSGLKVLDPFAGGGTTLVEARRLGAGVWGGDVDPLAVRITNYELKPAPRGLVEEIGQSLLSHLESRLGRYYPRVGGDPLHYFKLRKVTCPECSAKDLLYRSLVLARSTGAPGGVVRDSELTAFCPRCLEVHQLQAMDRTRLHCCGQYHDLWSGNFIGGRYSCSSCDGRFSHQELRTGTRPQVLVAVEETVENGRRRIRSPLDTDRIATRRADEYWARNRTDLGWQRREMRASRDGRPHSFGIVDLDQLFSSRQLLLYAVAERWIEEADVDRSVRAALRLALSNSITTNNELCGYATDYGRISPLFSVRGYSLPTLAVELNPLHASAGRGTLRACIRRVARAEATDVVRHVWSPANQRVAPQLFEFKESNADIDFGLRSATRAIPRTKVHSADICVFDPPYFDFIDYDDLSYVQRVLGGMTRRGGRPLHPEGGDKEETFVEGLASAFRRCVQATRPETPLVFTYHASSEEAWGVVGDAIDEAKLRVTAAWPVLSDSHMGHHSFPGNCEWDVALVCRRIEDVLPTDFSARVDDWVAKVAPLRVSASDLKNFEYAIGVCRGRYGQ